MATDSILRPGELKNLLLKEIQAADLADIDVREVGTVLEVKDGIARIYGLTSAMAEPCWGGGTQSPVSPDGRRGGGAGCRSPPPPRRRRGPPARAEPRGRQHRRRHLRRLSRAPRRRRGAAYRARARGAGRA